MISINQLFNPTKKNNYQENQLFPNLVGKNLSSTSLNVLLSRNSNPARPSKDQLLLNLNPNWSPEKKVLFSPNLRLEINLQ